ncbi:MAG TPA: AAA family ATPase [Terracidiphilus sp.]|nr:AAA family ATPase [Terracidiphilus sp.]
MKRFIVTGTPGAGKTAIIRQLEADGFDVVEEAATDVIALCHAKGFAEPWKDPSFIETIVDLQDQRQRRADRNADGIQFHDRSIFCTAALANYLGYPISKGFGERLDATRADETFQSSVFLVRSLGFVHNTDARRITLDEALRFERIHEETYRRYGFEIVDVGPGCVTDRVATIKNVVNRCVPAYAKSELISDRD